MKPILITIVLASLFLRANAQKPDTLKGYSDTSIYYAPEVEPAFPGGVGEFYAYLAKNIKTADTLRRDVNVQTILFIEMIIEKDGSISHVKILKDTSPSTSVSAIKVLSESPKWTPGMLHGKPVRVKYKIKSTIEFQQDDQ